MVNHVSVEIHLNFIAFAIPGLITAIALALVPERQAHSNKGDKSLQATETNAI